MYHFDSKALVEDYVWSLGLPATFLLLGFFMSNLPGAMFRLDDDNNWTLALPMPATAPIPLFDPADTGKWVKAIVVRSEEGDEDNNVGDLLNRRVYAATAYATPQDIVAAFRQAYPAAGRGARFVSVAHGPYLETLRQDVGLPGYAAEELLENMRLMDEGGYFGDAGLEESHALLVGGDKPTTWEEFMANKAPAFGGLK